VFPGFLHATLAKQFVANNQNNVDLSSLGKIEAIPTQLQIKKKKQREFLILNLSVDVEEIKKKFGNTAQWTSDLHITLGKYQKHTLSKTMMKKFRIWIQTATLYFEEVRAVFPGIPQDPSTLNNHYSRKFDMSWSFVIFFFFFFFFF